MSDTRSKDNVGGTGERAGRGRRGRERGSPGAQTLSCVRRVSRNNCPKSGRPSVYMSVVVCFG